MNDFYNKKRNTVLPKFLIGIAALFVLIGFFNLFQLPIKNFFYSVSSPVQKFLWGAGDNTAGILRPILSFGGLEQENENLKQENEKLLSELASLNNLKSENKALLDAMSCDQGEGFNLILTNVIGLEAGQDFIVIDKGSEDGISENMPIIDQERVLFGKVFQVYKNFSRVMLISNKDSVLDVKIQKIESIDAVAAEIDTEAQPNDKPALEAKDILGAIKGSEALGVYLDLVPLNSEIKEGDVLVTSALENIFPKDLLVGKVVKQNKDDLKPFLTAEVNPFFSVQNLNKLFVITNYKSEK